MSITLHLDDVVADELSREAAAESIPPEELASRMVRDALDQRLAERQWQSQNRRRLELIAKKKQAALTAEEQEDFNRLQELVSVRAAPFDRELRQTVEALRREVERLPSESAP